MCSSDLQIPAPPPPARAAPEIRIEQRNAPSAPGADDVKIMVRSLRVTGSTVFAEADLLALTGFVPGSELAIQTTICNEIRQSGQAVVIDEVATDGLFKTHHVPALYGFQSYISVPIQWNGAFFGTLCAIDPKPNTLNTPAVTGMFKLFADLIALQLETHVHLAQMEKDDPAQFKEVLQQMEKKRIGRSDVEAVEKSD